MAQRNDSLRDTLVITRRIELILWEIEACHAAKFHCGGVRGFVVRHNEYFTRVRASEYC